MRLSIALLAAAAALVSGAAQAAAVEVNDAVAQVTVIPEDRSDVRIEIVRANPALPLTVRTVGDRTIVEGGLDRRIRGCNGEGQGRSVQVSGIGRVPYADIPQIIVRTPRHVEFSGGGAVFGSVGRSASLKFGYVGCGDWTIGNVEGQLVISQLGSGDIRAGSAGETRLRIAGSGDVSTAALRATDVNVAGSGDVTVASVSGPLNVKIAGSGDVTVRGGRATALNASIAGSGDVSFDGVADRLTARIAGSGDVRAREVKGAVSKTVLGSGTVTVGS